MKYRNYKWKNRTPEIDGVKNARSSTKKYKVWEKKLLYIKFLD